MRNIHINANGVPELNKHIKEHEGDYMIIKNNRIMKSNCQDKNYEFQRLIGFAILEKHLKPRVSKQHISDEQVVVWVEGKGKEKEIIWKRASEVSESEYSKHIEGGIVTLSVDKETGTLRIDKHDSKIRMPR